MGRGFSSQALASRRIAVRVSVAVEVLGTAAVLGAVVALVARAPALAPSFAPEFVVLVGVAALTRRFGIALPGKGFASFILGVALYAILNHGWPAAVAATAVGVPAGDFLLRHLRLRVGLATAAHVAAGTALVGLLYEAVGGATGLDALRVANLGPLAGATLMLPIVTNGSFYAELAARGHFSRVDPKLVIRWEVAVFVAAAALAFAWTGVARATLPEGARFLFGTLVLVTWGGLWHVLRLGVHADELRLVQRLARAIAANANLAASFAAIRQLTGELLPWEQMGLARYRPEANEMELLEDTALRSAAGYRYRADTGLTAVAVQERKPVVANALSGHQIVVPSSEQVGSEILVPLFQGDELVGLWSVRHSDPTLYRAADGEMLSLLAPQLALSLVLNGLVRPLAAASEQITSYFDRLGATAHELHASSQEVTSAATKAEEGATRAAQLVITAAGRAGAQAQAASDAAAAGAETLAEGQKAEDTAREVRTAMEEAATRLMELGDVVAEGAAEVTRLREAAAEIERFSDAIATMASQTTMLALNATIEAARAGMQGRGFAVVADEVGKLADQSSEEARKVAKSVEHTRRTLDRAAALLEGLGTETGAVARHSGTWLAHLEEIVAASARTVAAGRRIAELAAQSRTGSGEIADLLRDAEAATRASASDAEAMAAAAGQQLRAVEDLARGAAQLSTLADQLKRATDFIRGDGAA